MMDKNEIIEHLERLARCATHTVGEPPFVMSLDDGIAVYEAIDIIQRPQRTGRWIDSSIPHEYYVCSECGGAAWYYDYGGEIAKSRYCPNCGAQMDEEVQMKKRMKEDAKKWEDIEQGLLQIPQDGRIEITSYTKEYLETITKQLDRIICILGEKGNG